MNKNYISFDGLSVFYSKIKEWINSTFSEKVHTHTISEVEDLQRRLDALTLLPDIETSEDVSLYLSQLSLTVSDLTNTVNNLIPSVGEIYITTSSEHPSVKFGGTWEQIKDTFLLAAGDYYQAGSIGGEASHTLTIDEMPIHTHDFNRHQLWRNESVPIAGSVEDGYGVSNKTLDIYTDTTTSTGRGQPHNNMPPYLTVYVWKRVA